MHDPTWGFLPEIDMPSIIGEYHFGASDTGLYHPGLIHSADQQDRAKAYMRKVIEASKEANKELYLRRYQKTLNSK